MHLRMKLATTIGVTVAGLSASALTAPGPSAATARRSAPAQALTLSAAQLAGQRVIYSYAGLTPPAALLTAIQRGEAAGVIFFRDNISSRAQIAGVISQLKRAAAQSPVKAPLLLMTDQEGGQVRRLPGGPTRSEKEIGSSPHPVGSARQAGRAAALNLKGVGMNVNLAPVLDVYRTPGNFIDEFGRSYSSDPLVVARAGAAFIARQQQFGVAATAKHFPGLGAAARSENTDLRPVTLQLTRNTLRTVDELPYQSAISAKVRLVMLSWATYPALDSSRPAGLSSTVVRGELRHRLKFTGVTITDALGAGALSHFGSTGNRAVLAAGAGMDLILCAAQSPSEGSSVVAALAHALHTGQLGNKAFRASVNRVTALRNAFASTG